MTVPGSQPDGRLLRSWSSGIYTCRVADVFTRQKRSEVMSRIRGRGNKGTEGLLAKIFRLYRVRGWRRNIPLPGKPDFTFRAQRLAVFIDGCFWHACPAHGTRPKSNSEYWDAKLARNRVRDRTVTRELRRRGWRVLRIWEHELKNPEKVIARLKKHTPAVEVPLAARPPIKSNASR